MNTYIILNKSLIKKIIIAFAIIILVILQIMSFIKEKQLEDLANIANDNTIYSLEITSSWKISDYTNLGLPIIIELGASWCGACQDMEPILSDLNIELREKAIIKKVDISKYPNLTNGFPSPYIPSQFFFNSDGTPYVPASDDTISFSKYNNEKGRHYLTAHVGYISKDDLLKILRKMGLNE